MCLCVSLYTWLTPHLFGQVFSLCHFMDGTDVLNMTGTAGSAKNNLKLSLIFLATVLSSSFII